jgi:predicted DNA-binding transcriptional regulator YafY
MERLVRLIAVLDNAGSVGAPAEQLIQVGEYGDADPGTQLGKDVKNLRVQGWQIDNVAGQGESARYRMTKGDNRLRVKLTPDQMAALQRAVIVSERADLAHKLGVKPASLPRDVTGIPQHHPHQQLSRSLQAVQLGCRIRFSYKGTPRLLHPGSVRFQNYRWYLSGIEQGSTLLKHFVVDNMSNVSLDKPGTAERVPAVQRIPLHPLLWEVDPPITATVRTTPDYVDDVLRWLRPPRSQTSTDGVVEMTYEVTHRAAFRARVYVLGPRVSLVPGEEMHDEVVAELRRMVGE